MSKLERWFAQNITGVFVLEIISFPETSILQRTKKQTDLAQIFLAIQNDNSLETSKPNAANKADIPVLITTNKIWITLIKIIYPKLKFIMRLCLIPFQNGNLHYRVLL